MPLFNCRLSPNPPLWREDGRLHGWFHLTDGRYWIDAGGSEIFRLRSGEYVDYYVVRLWEDVLEILPYVLEPLPDDILVRLRDLPQWLEFRKRAFARAASHAARSEEQAQAAWNLAYEATRWFSARSLDTAYLRTPPKLLFWRDGDTIVLVWSTPVPPADDTEALAWSSGDGRFTLSVDTLLREVVDFHEALMRDMGTLVDRLALEHGAKADELKREHADRKKMVTTTAALAATVEKTDWDAIRAALRALEAELG